jgi:nucleoside-diphosphate-sugar epimerase
MNIFVTGATGFVGSAIVRELIGAGHQVIGLARSDAAAASVAAAGAEVQRGDLAEPESLRSATAAADAVIHTGFIHDFANFKAVCEIDRRVIEFFGSALAGSNRSLIVTSGNALVAPGRVSTEEDEVTLTSVDFPRVATDEAARAVAERGVRVVMVRLSPSVHGDGDHGFVPAFITIAREKGVSAYVGDGHNRWNAVHRLDAARLYRLAVEKSTSASTYHAVADEAIAFRDIAEVIGKRLNVPIVSKPAEEAADHFGWYAQFAGLDCPASSQRTRDLLGWRPEQPGLIRDLNQSTRYFEPSVTAAP